MPDNILGAMTVYRNEETKFSAKVYILGSYIIYKNITDTILTSID